jgi:hypothetical protein
MDASTTAADKKGQVGIRLIYIAGMLICASLLYLGGIWPSLFTIFALIALPSPILFLIGAVHPGLIKRRRFLKFYLAACCIIAGLSWLIEIWWSNKSHA